MLVLLYWVKTNSIKKNAEALLDTCKGISSEASTEKIGNTYMSYQVAEQNQSIKTNSKSLNNLEMFEYLVMTVTN
jgi:hypothetical protein